jgi:hypothetical protein
LQRLQRVCKENLFAGHIKARNSNSAGSLVIVIHFIWGMGIAFGMKDEKMKNQPQYGLPILDG